jgi:phage baseplate assembly protein gpV
MFDSLNETLGLSSGNGTTRKYLGKVINNVDPLGLDRIQASVPGLYDEQLGPVPWIGPKKISPFGVGDTWGVYGTPAIGSNVLISLQDADPHYPKYESIQTKSSAADFPSGSSWGFKDPYGNMLKVTADKAISLTTGAGVTINISPSGSVSIATPGSATLSAGGSVSVSGSSISLNGPTTINGPTTLNGAATVSGVLTASVPAVLAGFSSSGPALTPTGFNLNTLETHLHEYIGAGNNLQYTTAPVFVVSGGGGSGGGGN